VYAYPADYYDHARWETASWDGRVSAALSIVRCSKCALMYSRPSFRENALGHVYPQDLVDPELSFERALTATRGKHKKMLAELAPLRTSGSLCDIGTRYGVLPHLARAAGFDGFGIEYNAASVRVATAANVPVYQGSVQDLPRVLKERGQTHVDVFVLDDVLEHLVDPESALRTLRSCQQPGGLLMLQQMDLDSLGHRLFQRHWYYLQPAAHMFYFSERTLRALLDRVGYDVQRVVRPALLRNLRRTMSRTLPGAALKLARAGARGKHADRKPSYLTCRFRSADDMFLVIAQKRNA
jgi:2-polyprenyl-3-methyl-5-hydroxy-6-metoxy-1,4-benzoquinol methylase